jgi:hypothetical protein
LLALQGSQARNTQLQYARKLLFQDRLDYRLPFPSPAMEE